MQFQKSVDYLFPYVFQKFTFGFQYNSEDYGRAIQHFFGREFA